MHLIAIIPVSLFSIFVPFVLSKALAVCSVAGCPGSSTAIRGISQPCLQFCIGVQCFTVLPMALLNSHA